MTQIRPYEPRDLDDLYHIALATGASGQDASHLHDDPKLVGHVYAAPYALLSPQCALVAQDEQGVAGYILGALDTRAFEAEMEEKWWPTLRPLYRDPSGTPFEDWSLDQLRSYQIHHPGHTPSRIALPYPSHLHINLLPRLQGQGVGRGMMDRWLQLVRDLGSAGVHLGVSSTNTRAMRFYRAYGWTEPVMERPPPQGVIWFAMRL